jgi:hypothetical protein
VVLNIAEILLADVALNIAEILLADVVLNIAEILLADVVLNIAEILFADVVLNITEILLAERSAITNHYLFFITTKPGHALHLTILYISITNTINKGSLVSFNYNVICIK